MPEQLLEVTNKELVIFMIALGVAFFILLGGGMGWFDPMSAGVVIITVVVFFAIAKFLESKGIFGKGMTMVFLIFGLGVVGIIAGLISRGVIPLVFYSARTPFLILAVTNGLLYALVVLSVGMAVVVAYLYYTGKLNVLIKKTGVKGKAE